jgi:hypothetical protein
MSLFDTTGVQLASPTAPTLVFSIMYLVIFIIVAVCLATAFGSTTLRDEHALKLLTAGNPALFSLALKPTAVLAQNSTNTKPLGSYGWTEYKQ